MLRVFLAKLFEGRKKKNRMNDAQIVKISLVFAMLGIIVLFVVGKEQGLQRVKIADLTEDWKDRVVEIGGTVERVTAKEKVTC